MLQQVTHYKIPAISVAAKLYIKSPEAYNKK